MKMHCFPCFLSLSLVIPFFLVTLGSSTVPHSGTVNGSKLSSTSESASPSSTTAAIQHLALLVVTVSIFIFFVAILGICWWQIEKEQKVSANLHHSMSVYKDAHEAATINALSTLSILDNVFSRSGFISRSTRAKGPATELATPKQQSKLGKVGSTFSAKVHSRLATKVYSKVYATKTSSLVKKSNSRPT